jgi:hypothetical protein
MQRFYQSAAFALFCFVTVSAQAIVIQLDYSYDLNGFFEQAGAKEAMRKAADLFEELITDSLLRIDPDAYFGSGNTWTARASHPGTGGFIDLVDLIVPADTLIVFVGGRNLGGSIGLGGPGGIAGGSGSSAWVNAVTGRGQAGALASPKTDFAPWGGTITFNNQSNWHFQVDGRPAGSNSFDFISTALHELGHLLGIGTANSWDAQIDSNKRFNGVRSMASFGGPVPVTNDQGHWQDDGNCPFDPNGVNNVASYTYGSFGRDHGDVQIAILDPQGCLISSETNLRVFTDLDLAALSDIGWEVQMPLQIDTDVLGPEGVSFSWPSSTGSSVYLQRVAQLGDSWLDILPVIAGDGLVKSISDEDPLPEKAFYRLSGSSSFAASSSLRVPVLNLETSADESVHQIIPAEPRMIGSCVVCADCCD